MSGTKIVVLAGSIRRESFAARLARATLAPLAALGADAELLDLTDFALPLYNGDLEAEQGLPEAAIELQGRLYSARGLLVVSPEYNGSITPLLKNTLDWCSRSNPADKARSGLAVYAGRAAALLGSSPGPLGGMRALFHVRDILGYLGLQVIPQQLAVGRANEAIGSDGRLVDARQQASLESVLAALVDAARRFA